MVDNPVTRAGRGYFVDQYRKHSQKPAPGFQDTLARLMEKYQALSNQAASRTEAALVAGEVDPHDVMIAVEEASLAFELILEVRNHLVEAYQELMRMQF